MSRPCYHELQMIRQLGKVFALAAMMVSIINAQCAISCSIQSLRGSTPVVQSSGALIHGASHACCPHGVPSPKQSPDNTCPHPVTHTDEARVENNDGATALYNGNQAALIVEPIRELSSLPAYSTVEPAPASASSGPTFLSSITILRI